MTADKNQVQKILIDLEKKALDYHWTLSGWQWPYLCLINEKNELWYLMPKELVQKSEPQLEEIIEELRMTHANDPRNQTVDEWYTVRKVIEKLQKISKESKPQ